MNTLTEVNPVELSTVSVAISWTGLQPGYALTSENAATLLAYCGGLASAATWVVVDVGCWRRGKLRQLYAVGSDKYNEAVGLLYRELSEYMPLSDTTWRAYLNVGVAVAYSDRVEGAGPSIYIPAMSLSPDAFESFVLSVKEGTHKAFLTQLYGQQATRIAPTASSNVYVAPDESDDVPYSASGPGVWADADDAVREYEGQSANDDLPVLSWETFERVKAMVEAALEHRWLYVEELAEALQNVFLPVDVGRA